MCEFKNGGDITIWEAIIDGVGTGRYYNETDGQIFYSDDLREWKKSNMTVEQLDSMNKEIKSGQ